LMFCEGDAVKMWRPFKELDGKVDEIDEARGKIKVLVSFSAENSRELAIFSDKDIIFITRNTKQRRKEFFNRGVALGYEFDINGKSNQNNC
jgi:hypothetical protein